MDEPFNRPGDASEGDFGSFAEEPAPRRGGLTTILTIVLILVIVNAVLCLGAAVYLWVMRPGVDVAPTPTPAAGRATVSRTPPRLTATATRPSATPAAASSMPAATPTRLVVTVVQPTVQSTPPLTTPTRVLASMTPPPARPTAPPQQPTALIVNDPTLSDLLTALANASPGQAVQVTLSEAKLDANIREEMAFSSDAGYQHERAQLRDGRLSLVGRAQIQGLSVRVDVSARLYASDCRLAIAIERMRLSGFPAPRFLVDQVAASAQQWADGYVNAVNFCVEFVSAENGRLILAGRAK